VTEQDLEGLLAEHASAHRVTGAVVGVLRDGVETVACFGPVAPESRFGAGSLTKSMVATVVALLAEDVRLSLDDPVAEHVPELRRLAWAKRATVRDLLANRSGLPLRAGLEFDFAAHEDRGDDALSNFAARVAAEEPTPLAWSYTNAGWSLLGRAIETVTGSVWEEAMRSMLLEPAEMNDTVFDTLSARALGPAGTTVRSTVGDMLRFAALHLDHSALAGLRRPQPSPRIPSWFDAWGLGWASFDWEGGPVWGWDSLLPGERAVLRFVPERRTAVVLMTNSDNGRLLYRSLFPELGLHVPPLRLDGDAGAAGEVSRFAGVYAWPDQRIEVTAAKTSLIIESEQGETEARPLDECTFLVDPTNPDNPTMTFGEFDAAGRPHVIYDMVWGLPRV
jgi:CubicO group peptidase (beta-lactamase class C family)